MKTSFLFPTLFLVLIFSFFSSASEPNDCSLGWREIDWKMVPFIDLNARYFSYQFVIPKGQKIQFRIEGEFPVSRYMSFHVYDQETEDPTSHIVDLNINPDTGSVNPFLPGINRYSPNRNYTLWTQQSKETFLNEQKLVLPFDETRDRKVDFWLRVYVSEEKKITLPRILAFDENKNPTNCPILAEKEWSIATEPGPLGIRVPTESLEGKVPLPMKNGEVHLFRPSTSTLGANLDNRYLSTRLDGKALFSPLTLKGRIERLLLKKHQAIQNIGDVTVFKFRTPSFPDTLSHLDAFTGKEDVRYWSICLSGADTYTSHCLIDSEIKTFVDPQGSNYAVVVIGPNDSQLRSEVLKAGYNFMEHSEHRIPLLFYRQMLARSDFGGNFENVLPISPEAVATPGPFTPFYGESKIGNFSPVGNQCWLETGFIDSLCGIKLSDVLVQP